MLPANPELCWIPGCLIGVVGGRVPLQIHGFHRHASLARLFASHRMIQGQGVWLDSSSGFKFILDLIGFCSAAVTIPKYVIPVIF